METLITGAGMTEGQKKQLKRFVEDATDKALEKLRLKRHSLQKLIENGGFFQEKIVSAIQDSTALFADEEERPVARYFFNSGEKITPIEEQIRVLRQAFPNLGSVNEQIANRAIIPEAEGWLAVPRWATIASNYEEAVATGLSLIKKAYCENLRAYTEIPLDSKHFCQRPETANFFETLGRKQAGHDILLFQAQLGSRHCGRSTRRALERMKKNEVGLNLFAVEMMILTNPHRFKRYEDMIGVCAGEDFSPAADGIFSESPAFGFFEKCIEFGTYNQSHASGYYGAISGFLT